MYIVTGGVSSKSHLINSGGSERSELRTRTIVVALASPAEVAPADLGVVLFTSHYS